MMKNVDNYLQKVGVPPHDLFELPTSQKRFSDNAHYRIECVLGGRAVPTVQQARAFLESAKENNLVINRLTETQGIVLYTDRELEEMIELAKQAKVGLVLSLGIRASYDTSAQAQAPHKDAGRIALRIRGSDNFRRAIGEVMRAVNLGCRGIIVYDEGLLWILGKMRTDGLLPPDLLIKVSAHCGHGNPAAIKLLTGLGANSVNPTRDLQLPMIAALRKATDAALDIHIDLPEKYGGWIRTHEAPEIVRIGAPVYLKCGFVRFGAGIESFRSGAKQASIVQQMVQKLYPKAEQSKPGAEKMAIPK
ncbi:MAG: peptidase [Candidatus Bathyarchaeota archaeon]|nr:MAG: peptidase [Candidatus Bathyarchaeota archaeon]